MCRFPGSCIILKMCEWCIFHLEWKIFLNYLEWYYKVPFIDFWLGGGEGLTRPKHYFHQKMIYHQKLIYFKMHFISKCVYLRYEMQNRFLTNNYFYMFFMHVRCFQKCEQILLLMLQNSHKNIISCMCTLALLIT